jgi:F420-dependent oxidoreductase-like protein
MLVSLYVTRYDWSEGSRAGLACVARAAEEAGVDTVWVPDHIMQADPNAQPRDAMLEATAALGFLAAITSRVQLGVMVNAVTFRPPAILIKAIVSVDALSRGRAWFGVGTGHHEGEAEAMGLPFPPVAERFERLAQTLRIAHQMFSGGESPFEGRHYRLARPICSPAPVRRPRVLIGGAGERKTLRLVAEFADACNIFDIPDGGLTVRRKLDVLARHCSEVGRRYGDIEKTIATRLAPGQSLSAFVDHCAELADLGIHQVVVMPSELWTAASLQILAGAVEPLSRIGDTVPRTDPPAITSATSEGMQQR